MHDPMVVAFEIHSPLLKRSRWREKRHQGRRWGWTRQRRTNPANLGEPVHPWWRPTGWTFALAGRVYGLWTFATVWHVEPGGADAFKVCKHASRWKLHVWHWKLQIHPLQHLRAALFDRCEECGRKGRPNISHGWTGQRLGWWKFRSRRGLFHMQCSGYGHLKQQQEQDHALLRSIFAALRVELDLSEAELLAKLAGGMEFKDSYRLQNLLGYRRDDNYKLVKGRS